MCRYLHAENCPYLKEKKTCIQEKNERSKVTFTKIYDDASIMYFSPYEMEMVRLSLYLARQIFLALQAAAFSRCWK